MQLLHKHRALVSSIYVTCIRRAALTEYSLVAQASNGRLTIANISRIEIAIFSPIIFPTDNIAFCNETAAPYGSTCSTDAVRMRSKGGFIFDIYRGQRECVLIREI